MKIIKNSIIPFKGFLAINLFGILFVREEYSDRLTPEIINHECIHTKQMKELLYIFFYIIYLLEWIFRVLFTNDRFTHNAYRNISFEKEAYTHMNALDYLNKRKLFSMWKNG